MGLVGQANEQNALVIKDSLEVFARVLGPSIKYNKSNVFIPNNVQIENREQKSKI